MSDNLPIDGKKQTPQAGFTAGLSAGVQKNGGEMMPNSVVQVGLQKGNTSGHIDIGYGGDRGMTSIGLGVEHDIDLGKGFSVELSADARVGRKNTHKKITQDLSVIQSFALPNDTDTTETVQVPLNLKYNPKNFKAEGKIMGKYKAGENLSLGLGVKGGIEYSNSQTISSDLIINELTVDTVDGRSTVTSFSADVVPKATYKKTLSVSPVAEVNLDVGKNKNTTITASAAFDDVHLGVTHKFGGK